MKLYSYFRSSASFRVRIALALKGLNYDYVSVHLAKGQQLQDEFTAVNADALVPVLEVLHPWLGGFGRASLIEAQSLLQWLSFLRS